MNEEIFRVVRIHWPSIPSAKIPDRIDSFDLYLPFLDSLLDKCLTQQLPAPPTGLAAALPSETPPSSDTHSSQLTESRVEQLISAALSTVVDKLASHPQQNQLQKRQQCFQFLKGQCSFGDSCRYSHDSSAATGPSQQFRPPPCREFQRGSCSRSTCKYAHVMSDACRNFQKGSCHRGPNCPYLHSTSVPPPSGTPPATQSSQPDIFAFQQQHQKDFQEMKLVQQQLLELITKQ